MKDISTIGYTTYKRKKEMEKMSIINMNQESFRKSITDGERLVCVEFWAPWCVYCRRITPAYEKVAEQLADSVIAGKVNIDEFPELARQEAIEVIPTFVLYKDGKVVDSIVAPESQAQMEEFVKMHLG